jgi:hypothetical protein
MNPSPFKNSPLTKRFNQVFIDFQGGKQYGKGLRPFAEAIHYPTHSAISKALNGEMEVSRKMIDGVCKHLKYNPEWLMSGTGKPKAELKEKNLFLDIPALRTELEIANKANDALAKRVTQLEYEMEQLKRFLHIKAG